MTPLRIPAGHVVAFDRVRELDDEKFDLLVKVLDEATPSLNVESLVEHLAESEATLDRVEAESLLEAVLSFASACRVQSWDRQEALAALTASPQLEVSDDEREVLASRLDRVLSVDSVAVMHKALTLAASHERTFQRAEVMTDIRPVFDGDVNRPLVGALISHDLQIEVIVNDRLETIVITLDSQDVDALRSMLNRADEKASVLKQLLANMSVAYLGWGDQ